MLRWLLCGAALACGLGSLSAAGEDERADVKALLAQIKDVGREGTGNVKAARAWKALVARGPSVLPELLNAMDDDNLTSTNWLRSAVDAVAEHTLAEGKPLPIADLEKFLADTSHPPCGRRLAYEWIVKVDKKAPDRFLHGMLADPSPELRRDAVAVQITQAKGLLDKGEKKEALAAYNKAFQSACDEDQIDEIATQLKSLGEKVDKAKHLGVVRSWHLLSSFDHHNGVGFSKAYPPEKGVDLSASYKDRDGKDTKWIEEVTTDPAGIVDLNKVIGKHKGAVAYAFAVIDSPKEKPVQVRVGCICAVKVFLNGKEIFAREEYHHGMRLDQYVARGTLKAGRNELLLKICQNEQKEAWAQEWKFQARLCEPVGAAVAFTQPASKTEPKEAKP